MGLLERGWVSRAGRVSAPPLCEGGPAGPPLRGLLDRADRLEVADDFGVSATARLVQRRAPLAFTPAVPRFLGPDARVDVGAARYQQSDDSELPLLGSANQRVLVPRHDLVDDGAAVEQEAHDVGMTL